MRISIFIASFFVSISSYGQEIVTDLNGFRLGQFRDVPKNEFGMPLQEDRFDDGFEYEIYLVEKDTSAYMIFEYASHDLQTLWSIQLTGYKEGFDCSFKGLKLGMSEKEIVDILGKPSAIESAGEYGDKWVYDNTNFSLEVSPNGTLGGIKIIDMSYEFFPDADLNKIPSFKEYKTVLKSRDRNAVAGLLAPGIEIYKDDSVHFFSNPIAKEIDDDQSGIFRLTNEFAQKLDRIDPQDSLQYEENLRVALGQDTKHVAKFTLDGVYSEIVFKYMFGRYLIWEIKMN
ncbi:MAG: hypothetical protein RIC80_23260 [Cyclobacteriaceae bacterium]